MHSTFLAVESHFFKKHGYVCPFCGSNLVKILCVVRNLLHHLLDWLDYSNYPVLPMGLFSVFQDRMIRWEVSLKGLQDIPEATLAPMLDVFFNIAIGRNGQVYFVHLN